MSIFDLDIDGQQALAEEARLNPLDLTQVKPGFFDNTGSGIGQGVMRGGARVGQFIGMAAAAPIALYEKATDQEGRFTDPYFRVLDDTMNNAVDYWTPDAAEVGTAGRVLGGLSEMVLPLMAGAGNPALLIGSQEMGVATDLTRQGVSPGASTAAGVVQGLSTAVGFKIPFLGKTLLSRIGSGAGGNLLTNMGATAAQQQILERTGNEAVAEQFNPWDLEARAIDVLTGVAFGALAHLQMRPGDRAAVAAANNAKHFQSDTAPGVPVDAGAAVAHQDALEVAIRDTLTGEPVRVPQSVMEADFVGRPVANTIDPAIIPDELKAHDAFLAEQAKKLRNEPPEGLSVKPAVVEQASIQAVEPASDRAATAQVDPIVSAAQEVSLASDLRIPTGEIDIDGNPKSLSARELFAQIDADMKQAQTDVTAFDAAVNCFLSKGGS